MALSTTRRGFVKAAGISALGLGGASILAGCGSSSSSDSDSGDTIKIGVLGPYSGDVAQYGLACRNGAELYFEQNPDIAGKTVSLDEQDEKGDSTEAVNAYNKMVESGDVAIIGDVTSTPSIAVAQASAADNLPCVTPSATAADVISYGSNQFRACVTDPFQGKVMADFAQEQGWNTVATIFNSGDDYSTGVNSAFVEEASNKGITVSDQEGYAAGDVDFNGQLTSIIATSPDAIFAPNYYQDDGKIVTQARQQGYTGVIFGVDGWSNIASGGYASAEDLQNCYYCCSFVANNDDEKVKSFVDAYKEKFNEDPTNFCALGYDAAMVVAEGIKKVLEDDSSVDLTSDDGKQKIIDAIAGNTVSGVTGDISYEGTGDPVKSTLVISFAEDGTEQVFTTIDPE